MKRPFIKRALSIILAANMALSLAACEKSAPQAVAGSVSAAASQQDSSTPPPTINPSEQNNYSVQIGESIHFGAYDWLVLEVQDGRALIITEQIIENRFYDIGQYTWANSGFREYLNGEFYNTFNPVEQAQIISVINANPDNPWYGTVGGEDTEDRIFLLSIDEVVKYYGDSGLLDSRQPKTGVHWIDDEFNESRIAYHVDDKYNYMYNETSGSWWRLRSPGQSVVDMAGVNERGFIFPMGSTVSSQIAGLRPALWLKTKTTGTSNETVVSAPISGNGVTFRDESGNVILEQTHILSVETFLDSDGDEEEDYIILFKLSAEGCEIMMNSPVINSGTDAYLYFDDTPMLISPIANAMSYDLLILENTYTKDEAELMVRNITARLTNGATTPPSANAGDDDAGE